MKLLTKKITIAVVDDDDDDQLLIKRAFEHSGLKNPILSFADGIEFIEYAEGILNQEFSDALEARQLPGLILLDLNMPRMDGREALRRIRGNPALRHIPTIVLTTSQAQEDIDATYHAGVNSFITKPVTVNGINAVIQRLRDFWFEVVTLPDTEIKTKPESP